MAEKNLKILEIDDNLENMTTVRSVLAHAFPGAAVFMAQSGAEGLALALAEDPDMILLDIVMPEMNGFEVCQRLKADDRLKAIPVVFMTADQVDKESRIKALEVGGDGFLRKPFEVEELVAQVRTMAKIKAAAAMQGLEPERLRSLADALSRVKALSRLLPICASCKKIRNDKGYWEQVEQYMKKAYSDLDFSHGCCPDCMRKLYPEYVKEVEKSVKAQGQARQGRAE